MTWTLRHTDRAAFTLTPNSSCSSVEISAGPPIQVDSGGKGYVRKVDHVQAGQQVHLKLTPVFGGRSGNLIVRWDGGEESIRIDL